MIFSEMGKYPHVNLNFKNNRLYALRRRENELIWARHKCVAVERGVQT